jgi:hypothetical protein
MMPIVLVYIYYYFIPPPPLSERRHRCRRCYMLYIIYYYRQVAVALTDIMVRGKGRERSGNFLLPQPLQKLLKWASSCISDGLTRTQEIA